MPPEFPSDETETSDGDNLTMDGEKFATERCPNFVSDFRESAEELNADASQRRPANR
ncbi:hypothetical protein Pan216_12590 [Planctomycetes bacterium Pan216]|uniref:Uncharacterized protein n=1 Tax=Kolteria novifilia TaxID=2527975 RepID=A0A518B0C6_9BACT|nr:hypothetical protein Pan216_12590 [Planctomycetes bacterium Pan216]